MVTVNQVLRVVKSILSHFSSRSRLIRHLERQQNLTQSQDEWMDLAERIDNVQGNDVWRSDPNCPLYERDRIAARIDEFVHLMRRRDIFELVSFRASYLRNRRKVGLVAVDHSHKRVIFRCLSCAEELLETCLVCCTRVSSVRPWQAPKSWWKRKACGLFFALDNDFFPLGVHRSHLWFFLLTATTMLFALL